ncbi:uncharacterized protein LOC129760709 [Uranotaenia lowii]|uniref:uncharacterized protein LOC129760709 n=1 Tax=Uranotaenia lowii TaxID=190385 RepID=UPI00247A459A|nr:uncharacterized protein LOC129760709 [Uranotaenia lowii]XP_055614343.1 uncharacterized protein LOC129760709 [Uranotaenia lowii]
MKAGAVEPAGGGVETTENDAKQKPNNIYSATPAAAASHRHTSVGSIHDDSVGDYDYSCNQVTITADKPQQMITAMGGVAANDGKNGKVKSPPGPRGQDFVPPDGGWGWVVVIAAGCSNLCTFPGLQQFGLLFRDRMTQLGINSSQITSIINTNAALMSMVGLANGPMFRQLTYRQVALFGATLVTVGLCLTSIADSFIVYLLTFSILYGSGVGITASANSLALNTYFKERRRYATGFSWTATALGPIISPHVITFLLPLFGVNGTVLIFAGFATNAFVCSMLLQPVEWHSKPVPRAIAQEEAKEELPEIKQCSLCQFAPLRKDHSILSSQYLYNADDVCAPGYEIIDPGTPMLSRANDGWYSGNTGRSHYGSRMNLQKSVGPSTRPSSNNLVSLSGDRGPKPISDKRYQAEKDSNRLAGGYQKRPNTFNREKEVLKLASRKLEQIVDHETESRCTCEEERRTLLKEKQTPPDEHHPDQFTLLQRIVVFFDLDLLKDWVYVNIMVGITLANFAEVNFSVLTPFILGDFGLRKEQVALVMSLLGAMDIFCRFFIPFVAGKIGWENRTFFLFGVMNMAMGRIVLAHWHTFPVVIAVACWIGFNKGLRTVFMALAIPSHVPLDRLPGATGIQLMFSGLFYLIVGPVVGFIRDRTNYTITLHCLNIATYTTAIFWIIEMYYLGCRKSRSHEIPEDDSANKDP